MESITVAERNKMSVKYGLITGVVYIILFSVILVVGKFAFIAFLNRRLGFCHFIISQFHPLSWSGDGLRGIKIWANTTICFHTYLLRRLR